MAGNWLIWFLHWFLPAYACASQREQQALEEVAAEQLRIQQEQQQHLLLLQQQREQETVVAQAEVVLIEAKQRKQVEIAEIKSKLAELPASLQTTDRRATLPASMLSKSNGKSSNHKHTSSPSLRKNEHMSLAHSSGSSSRASVKPQTSSFSGLVNSLLTPNSNAAEILATSRKISPLPVRKKHVEKHKQVQFASKRITSKDIQLTTDEQLQHQPLQNQSKEDNTSLVTSLADERIASHKQDNRQSRLFDQIYGEYGDLLTYQAEKTRAAGNTLTESMTNGKWPINWIVLVIL